MNTKVEEALIVIELLTIEEREELLQILIKKVKDRRERD